MPEHRRDVKKGQVAGGKDKIRSLLPTKKREPSTRIKDYIILVYGREKIGKSSLCSMFPNTLFVLFEAGTNALSVYDTRMKSWTDFKRLVQELAGDNRFETIVIDTVDLAYDLCEDHVCRNQGIEHPSDEKWGKGWRAVRKEFSMQINKLTMQGKGVIFVSHEATQSITTKRGAEHDRIMPSMSKQARKVIEPMVDIWSYMYTDDDERRYLQILADDVVMAGNRINERFKGVKRIYCGTSPEEAYKNLMAAWDGNPPKDPKEEEKKAQRIEKRQAEGKTETNSSNSSNSNARRRRQ